MARLRAAVLAAGRGVRMGGEIPKTLLPVGDREPLLHYILTGLARSEIDDLLVVTGHRHGDIQAFVEERWPTGKVTYAFNARYASWGNFHTVRIALDQSPGYEVLVVNSDVIVHPEVFRRTISAPGDLVLAVERRHRLDAEDMKVKLRGDVVLDIGKDLKQSLSHGEYDGVSLIRPRAARRYLDVATALQWRGNTGVYYEDVYREILSDVDARAAEVRSGEYAEIDTPDDVSSALRVLDAHADAWSDSAQSATQT